MGKRFLVVVVFIAFVNTLFGQSAIADRAFTLSRVIQKFHISPKPVDDSLSAYVFNEVMEKLDPYQIYFTDVSLNRLSAWKYKLDDEIRAKQTGFLQELSTVYQKELQQANQTVNAFIAKPFSFTQAEMLQPDGLSTQERTAAKVKLRLAQVFKWRMLEQFRAYADGQPITADLVRTEEADVRAKVGRQWEGFFKEQSAPANTISPTIADLYLSAIASWQDPHTEFMQNDEKEDFEDELSSESKVFGISVDTDDDGNYIISDILPGSSAFASAQVHEKDKIISIRGKDGKLLVTKDAGEKEIVNAIGAEQETVELTLQSADGLIKTVKLNKSVVRKEENVVRGWILEGKNRIGYISLPTFYTRMVEGVGTSCAEDVAREVVKLKKENIQGLILDLRYNGGGSVEEAASLLGIFVDIGPLGMVRMMKEKAEIIKDINRGQIWDGPMTVMINGASASASELVAATLQDYRKALIVGSPSFGKATMQVIIPVDSTLDFDNPATFEKIKAADDKSDYLKVTIGKIYRITGSSAQKAGVVPDLYLPDRFEVLDVTERGYPTALAQDTVMRKLNYTAAQPWMSSAALESFRQNVVMKDSAMQNIANYIKKEKGRSASSLIPLDLPGFNAWVKGVGDDGGPARGKTASPFTVRNTAMDAAYNAMEQYQKENDEQVMKTLVQDIYLRQTFTLVTQILSSKQ